jgi:hypothetical protein
MLKHYKDKRRLLTLNVDPYFFVSGLYSSTFCICIYLIREPGSSVSVVSGYGLDDRAIEVRSPAEAKVFFP